MGLSYHCVIPGAQWRLLPENERRYWKDKAKEVKDDHRLSNPGYRYKPERKKTGRPPKGESRNERNLENARDQEEKENDQRLGDDNVARPFIGSTEDNHATGNTRAIAGPQRVSLSTVPLISRQSQNNSSPPLHSAVRAPRAETSTEWCYAGQVMPYFQPRPASVLHPAFQQARAPRPVTTYRGQPARPDPSLSQVVNEAANHGLALPYVANSSTYYLVRASSHTSSHLPLTSFPARVATTRNTQFRRRWTDSRSWRQHRCTTPHSALPMCRLHRCPPTRIPPSTSIQQQHNTHRRM